MYRKTIYKFLQVVVVIVATLLAGKVSAQGGAAVTAYSPYTMFGIGELQTIGTTQMRAMGGVGVAWRSTQMPSIVNPAGYSATMQNSFLFEVGIEGNFLQNAQRQYDASGAYTGLAKNGKNSVNIHEIAVQFPLTKGLGMGINDGDTTAVHEHAPTIQTDARIKDINFDLSLAGVKCGFSEGVFVMDGQTGMITATQVESDDRDTIQTIKDDRDALKAALAQAFAGADAMATLYGLAPLGEYEANFNFGDITYSYEEDKAAWRMYAAQGWIPKWLYFVKFEGMSEEEAKALTAEAEMANMEAGLFGGGAPTHTVPPKKSDDKKKDDKKDKKKDDKKE